MSSNHSALVAVVQTRRDDEALMSAVGAAARHLQEDAQARADAMRAEARELRWAGRRNLIDARSHVEAAGQRLRAIGALELEDSVKDAALRAAREDLSKRRWSLRKAAEELEAAVPHAQALEAKADEVMSAVERRPEVAAWRAIQSHAENGRAASHPRSRGSRPSMSARVTESHDG